MGLLEPKNKVVGTTGTGSVLLTIGTIDLVSVLPIKTLWQLKIRSSVLPAQCWKYHPLKIIPRNSPKLSIDGSPKPLGVLRRNFGEMMNTTRRGYAQTITASNFLQLPELQILAKNTMT
jgi:hypothetical protein